VPFVKAGACKLLTTQISILWNPNMVYSAWVGGVTDTSHECERAMQAKTAVVLLFVFIAAGGTVQAQSLRVTGTAGYLAEWELNGELTQRASGGVKEFSGPLVLKHVGLCSHDGPQETSSEIRVQILQSGSSSQIQTQLLYEGTWCTYRGQLADSSTHGFMACKTAGIPLTFQMQSSDFAGGP
jgi:hypothetical protein